MVLSFVYEGYQIMKLPKNLPDCTIFLLAKAYQNAHARLKKRLKPYGLTNLQHLVLEALWYREGQTAAELGKLLILDKATLSGVLDRLNNAGWIVKTQDDQDKRIMRIYPSDKGKSHKNKLIREREEANTELLSGFSPEEQALLKRFLKDLF